MMRVVPVSTAGCRRRLRLLTSVGPLRPPGYGNTHHADSSGHGTVGSASLSVKPILYAYDLKWNKNLMQKSLIDGKKGTEMDVIYELTSLGSFWRSAGAIAASRFVLVMFGIDGLMA